MYLTRGSETLFLVSWELSRFSEWKNSVSRNLRVNSWMSRFSSMVFGFVVGVNFSPLLKKSIVFQVLGVKFPLSSRFDCGLGIKKCWSLLVAWSLSWVSGTIMIVWLLSCLFLRGGPLCCSVVCWFVLWCLFDPCFWSLF